MLYIYLVLVLQLKFNQLLKKANICMKHSILIIRLYIVQSHLAAVYPIIRVQIKCFCLAINFFIRKKYEIK